MYSLAYSVAATTTDDVYEIYLQGEISYWDYLLIYIILTGGSVPTAIDYANTYDPGGSFTARGRGLATQVLIELGREDQVPQLPAAKGAFNWKTWLPLGLGAVAVLALTVRRKS